MKYIVLILALFTSVCLAQDRNWIQKVPVTLNFETNSCTGEMIFISTRTSDGGSAVVSTFAGCGMYLRTWWYVSKSKKTFEIEESTYRKMLPVVVGCVAKYIEDCA
jgi:hypothetical protein